MADNGHIAISEPGGTSPFLVLYVHKDAHPDTLMPILTSFLDDFARSRGFLEHIESLLAWLIKHLIDKTNPRQFSDIGICRHAHPMVDYHYGIKLDPDGGAKVEYRESRSFEIKLH